jgi:hypothetical protein
MKMNMAAVMEAYSTQVVVRSHLFQATLTRSRTMMQVTKLKVYKTDGGMNRPGMRKVETEQLTICHKGNRKYNYRLGVLWGVE